MNMPKLPLFKRLLLALLLILGTAPASAMQQTLTNAHILRPARPELVEGSKDVIVDAHIFGQKPLHQACHKGDLQATTLLLKRHANIYKKDQLGWTGLHYASAGGHWEVVQALVLAGAPVTARDNWLYAPLHLACAQGNAQIAQLLLDGGSRPFLNTWCTWPDKKTPLDLACTYRRPEVIALLLARGALITFFVAQKHMDQIDQAPAPCRALWHFYNKPKRFMRIVEQLDVHALTTLACAAAQYGCTCALQVLRVFLGNIESGNMGKKLIDMAQAEQKTDVTFTFA